MLAALIVAAVLEEIIFRAGIQESLLRLAARRPFLRVQPWVFSLPNLAAALLFALAHGLFRSWILAAAVFPVALLLGWLYERQRRVWPCIAVHAVLNTLWFLMAPWFGPSLI